MKTLVKIIFAATIFMLATWATKGYLNELKAKHAQSHIMTCKIVKHKTYLKELTLECKHAKDI